VHSLTGTLTYVGWLTKVASTVGLWPVAAYLKDVGECVYNWLVKIWIMATFYTEISSVRQEMAIDDKGHEWEMYYCALLFYISHHLISDLHLLVTISYMPKRNWHVSPETNTCSCTFADETSLQPQMLCTCTGLSTDSQKCLVARNSKTTIWQALTLALLLNFFKMSLNCLVQALCLRRFSSLLVLPAW
jgi:hypothetical protein